MYRFHVVVWHRDMEVFIPVAYNSDHDTLAEQDMLEIEKYHADLSRGVIEVKTVIISWQLLRK